MISHFVFSFIWQKVISYSPCGRLCPRHYMQWSIKCMKLKKKKLKKMHEVLLSQNECSQEIEADCKEVSKHFFIFNVINFKLI